jgi:hypothetical protein
MKKDRIPGNQGRGKMNPYVQLGASLVPSIPFIIIAMVGIYIAFVRREAHPRASLLVSLGLIGLLLNSLGSTVLNVWVQNQNVVSGSASAYANWLVMFNLGLYSLHLAALLLITMAVFAGRDYASRERSR